MVHDCSKSFLTFATIHQFSLWYSTALSRVFPKGKLYPLFSEDLCDVKMLIDLRLAGDWYNCIRYCNQIAVFILLTFYDTNEKIISQSYA